MKPAWRTVPLQSLCNDFRQDIVDGPFGSNLQRKDYITDGVPVLKIQNVRPFEIALRKMDYVSREKYADLRRHSFKRGDIVMTKLGSPLGVSAVVDDMDEGVIVADLVRIRAQQIDTRYLCYHLNSSATSEYINSMQKGTTRPRVTLSVVRQLPIALPSPAEQRRIVAILDEAFEGIATAKANAEKNLHNAREWAARQLTTVLAAASAAGKPRALESLVSTGCSLSYGIVQPGDELPGGLPVVRPVDLGAKTVRAEGLKRIDPALARSYVRTTLEGGDLLLCVRGTTGTVAVAESALAGANVTRGIVPIRFDPKLISQALGYYLLRSEPFQAQIRAKTYGTALMQINIGDLRKIVVSFPPIDRQTDIVEQLDAVQEAGDQLAAVYERKMAAFDELKKSLLHQAFSGQLTSTKGAPVGAASVCESTSPEFSATIIALAYARHMRQQRERTFGRVKEQKLLHLVEVISGLNLGRQPMKDAAGPNDFQHMLNAEDWARRGDFFELTQREGGYDFRRLPAFDKLLARAPQVLGSNLDRIEPVIDLIVSMDKEEVEVFATVHAAWNNLLIDGAEVTDEAIVWEARAGWHADKLSISEAKFRQAIALIRSKSLVPGGSGKYVGGQKLLAFR